MAAPRAQSLLAYLALHADQQPSRRHVAFLMWPDSTEAQARTACASSAPGARRGRCRSVRRCGRHDRVAASRHRPAAGRPGRRSGAARRGRAGRRRDPLAERAALERAAGLYRGDLLPASYDDWVTVERERLALRHQRLLDRLVGLLERVGDYRAAIEWGQHRLRLDPLDERVYRWLMRLHALNHDRAGRPARVPGVCRGPRAGSWASSPSGPRESRRPGSSARSGWPAAPGARRRGHARASPGCRCLAVHWPARRVGPGDDVVAAHGSGRRGLVVIRGEAGIGKSRLAAELCEWARQQGIASASSRAWAAEGRLAYAPVADWLRSPALRRPCRLDAVCSTRSLGSCPSCSANGPISRALSPLDRALAASALFQALPARSSRRTSRSCSCSTTCSGATRHPRVAALPAALRSRRAVAGRRAPCAGGGGGAAPGGRVLVAACARRAGRPRSPWAARTRPRRRKLAALVAGRALRPGAARHLYAETEGNPLFVVETVRALEERGNRRDVDAPIPPPCRRTCTRAIAARLGQLTERPGTSPRSRRRPVGRSTLRVVQAAADVDEATTVGAIEELLERRLVREQGRWDVRLLARQDPRGRLRQMSEPRRRPSCHRRVAEALQQAHRDTLDDVAAQIAAHYAYAGITDRAAAFYRRAAEVAQRVGANHDAIALSRQGLDQLAAMEPGPDRDDLELGLQAGLGASLVATDGYGGADVGDVLRAVSRAVSPARSPGQPADPASPRDPRPREGPDRGLLRHRSRAVGGGRARRRFDPPRRGPLRTGDGAPARRGARGRPDRARDVAGQLRPAVVGGAYRPVRRRTRRSCA